MCELTHTRTITDTREYTNTRMNVNVCTHEYVHTFVDALIHVCTYEHGHKDPYTRGRGPRYPLRQVYLGSYEWESTSTYTSTRRSEVGAMGAVSELERLGVKGVEIRFPRVLTWKENPRDTLDS